MRASLFASVLFVMACSTVYGQPTPKDAPLASGGVTEITCECTTDLTKKYNASDALVGTYHYKVYIPEGYDSDPNRKYPVFFFFSPNGNADMGHLADRLKEEKWIGIMHVEAKNGTWGPIVGNMIAAYDDATTRLRINEKMKYATGFSGGARMASVFACLIPDVSGLICNSAGFGYLSGVSSIPEELIKKKIPVCMFVASKDDNLPELIKARESFKEYSMFYGDTYDGDQPGSQKKKVLNSFEYLLCNTYFNSPKDTIPKTALLTAMKNAAAVANDASTTVLGKFDVLNCISEISTQSPVASEADFKDVIDSAKKQLEELKKDATYKTELAANESYLRMQGMEITARNKLLSDKITGNSLKATLAQMAAAYDAIAKKNPNTEGGRAAAIKVEKINSERVRLAKQK